MVTLSLFDTILSLHCEDLMLELLLKYLLPCQHVPISHRYKVNQVVPFAIAATQFLDLSPEVMKLATDTATLDWATDGLVAMTSSSPQHGLASKTIGANWNHYGLHTSDSLYGNYHAYLYDAKTKIGNCKLACQERWSSMYSYQRQKSAATKRGGHTRELMREFLEEFDSKAGPAKTGSAMGNGYATAEETSLNSLGEGSSGYESFRNRLEDEETAHNSSEDGGMKLRDVWKSSQNKCDSLTVYDIDLSEDLFTQGTVYLGELMKRRQNDGNSKDNLCLCVFRSLFELHLGQVANLYQQLFVREFTCDGRDYATSLVPTANSTIDFIANGHCHDVRHAVLLPGAQNIETAN